MTHVIALRHQLGSQLVLFRKILFKAHRTSSPLVHHRHKLSTPKMSLPCFALSHAHPLTFRDAGKRRSAICRRTRMSAASRPLPETTPVVGPDEWDLRLGSPSKINLFLRVVGKRSDGYHELASLFQAISLRDNLFFSVKTEEDENPEEDSLECDTPDVPTDSSNLVIKALDKFREKTGVETYFKVRLEKRIPHAAGLGGGSGNAATALWAANELSGKPCTIEQLAEFGAEFGSDISFFLSSGTAYCTGRGEILEYLPSLPPQTLYIVKPPEGLSTPEVFGKLDLSTCSEADPRQLLRKMQNGVIFADFVNDLETPSFELVPRLKTIKEELYKAGFNVVLMSGSGTSFFCLGEPRARDFLTVFPVEHNVQIFEAMFHGRRFEDMWYFERKPLKPLKEMEIDNW